MPIDQELRRRSLSASEFGSVFGVDPRRDARALWAQKKGQMPEAEPKPWMYAGKRWERPIMTVYAETSNREVEWFDRTIAHPDYPWMVASPDALVRQDRETLDAKLVQWHQRHRWGANPADVPEQNILQIHVQMMVLGFDTGKIIAWAGESELRIYDYERDEEMHRALRERGYEFWKRYIHGDETPPITGSEESAAWLRHHFPRNFGTVRKATMGELALLEDYTDVKIEEKTTVAGILERKALLENQIKECIGPDDGLEWFGGRFTWKKIKDSTGVNWEALARTLLLARPEEERAALEQQFIETTPGYRRIYFKADRLTQCEAA